MTDKMREELRKVFEAAVRAGGADTTIEESPGGAGNYYTLCVLLPVVYSHPELSSFRQMCLSGLLGDPAQSESALVDAMLEMGWGDARAVAERATLAERERCLRAVLDANNATEPSQLNYDSHSLLIYETIAGE